MSTADDDYTRSSYPASNDFNPNDYSFLPLAETLDVETIERDSQARDAEFEANRFREIEPGEHELFVKNFKEAPKPILREGYLRGQKVTWESALVKARLAKVGDPNASVVDLFDLPPRDRAGQEAYLHASKHPDGKNPGFMARKLVHFLDRLGFPCSEGRPLPAEACNLGNWIGRRVHAITSMERPKPGSAYPPRAQVNLFSYRPSGAASAAPARAAGRPAAYGSAPAPQASRPAARPVSRAIADVGLGEDVNDLL